MLEIRGLDASYGDTQVLRGISLDVRQGEIVTLIGRNGAGKSTTLKSIMGDIPRRSGSIMFKGQEIVALGPERICRLGMGYVPEDRGMFGTLSVLENLTIGKPLGPRAWPLERIFGLFPVLKARAHQRATNLSGGEQQMLSIARPLYMGADFLLLDEPTEGLAPVIIDTIGRVVSQLKTEGLTVLLVEQNLPFATSVADRHNLVENGRIIRTMSNDDVIREEGELLAHLGV
ncbi:MAG TPA: ABC transporter ATP-binding protein [Rhodopila sp.]|uniref:ABC transporter ATP-binding protein n=1 Tax=Rhodopila sp. TaxID=2480087 RepID=UPI002C7D3AA2|nr:ABC transporter ATP-binding protein [Rhodopila sp.]HVY14932.1 ABC transporter ATP-binding protein [Rhodopila sp.]